MESYSLLVNYRSLHGLRLRSEGHPQWSCVLEFHSVSRAWLASDRYWLLSRGHVFPVLGSLRLWVVPHDWLFARGGGWSVSCLAGILLVLFICWIYMTGKETIRSMSSLLLHPPLSYTVTSCLLWMAMFWHLARDFSRNQRILLLLGLPLIPMVSHHFSHNHVNSEDLFGSCSLPQSSIPQ